MNFREYLKQNMAGQEIAKTILTEVHDLYKNRLQPIRFVCINIDNIVDKHKKFHYTASVIQRYIIDEYINGYYTVSEFLEHTNGKESTAEECYQFRVKMIENLLADLS